MRYKTGMENPPGARRRRRWQVGGVAVVAVFVILIAVAVGSSHRPSGLRPGGPVPGAARAGALFAGIRQSGISLGDPRAPVMLVEFADLQCPICAQFAHDALPGLVTRYVRSGRVQVAFRSLDFIGPDSTRAARMGAALSTQDRLWQFLDVFYTNQRPENTGYADDAFLRALASAIPGVDLARALNERNGPAAEAAIAQAKSLAKWWGIASTPSFLLGRRGQPLTRFYPAPLDASSFAGALDRVLAGAGG